MPNKSVLDNRLHAPSLNDRRNCNPQPTVGVALPVGGATPPRWAINDMNKKTRNITIGALFIGVLTYSTVDTYWPKWFPSTEIVVRNESGQQVRSIVIEAPRRSVDFGTLEPGDVVTKKIERRPPESGFYPDQHGTLADGTSITPSRVRGADMQAFSRLEYIVNPDGTIGGNVGLATE